MQRKRREGGGVEKECSHFISDAYRFHFDFDEDDLLDQTLIGLLRAVFNQDLPLGLCAHLCVARLQQDSCESGGPSVVSAWVSLPPPQPLTTWLPSARIREAAVVTPSSGVSSQ